MGARSRAFEAKQGRALLPLLLLAFALRVYNLAGTEFWFDEALTANVSGLGWQGILEHLRSAPFEHPPLYFLSLYPWQKLLGTSEFAFRIYSVFWGVLFIVLLYALVRLLANRHLALITAALAVFSPFLVAYSREARMYSLLPCLAVVTILLFVKALRQPERPAWWLAYLVLLAAGVATHYFIAWIWLANSLYLAALAVQKRRISPWAVIAHVMALVAVLVWLLAAPGLRASLARLWQGEMAFGLAYKVEKVMPTLVLSELEGTETPLLARLLAIAGWLLALLGAWSSRQGTVISRSLWRLLLLLLVVTLAGSFLVPYSVLGRHLGYLHVPLSLFWALGLVALARKGGAYLGAGLVLFLFLASYGLAGHYGVGSDRSFGRALDYIDERGQEGDVLILTQPSQAPLETYYNTRRWPVRYLPAAPGPLDPAEIEATLRPLLEAGHRLWLGPVGAWTADPESMVEQWLVEHAFEAEQTWFPDSHAVSLYVPGQEDMVRLDLERYTFGGQIRLRSLEVSPLRVESGESIRMRFRWRSGREMPQRYQVSVLLVDQDGVIWAGRESEPCGGWCATDSWPQGATIEDRHALLVPPGTPPGEYRLQVAWAPLGGGPRLEVDVGGELQQQVTVGQVTVVPGRPRSPIYSALPNAGDTAFGDLVLLGHTPASAEAQPGEVIHLETHWQARARPQAAYTLLVELLSAGGQVANTWQIAPFTGSYSTELWQQGEYVRGLHPLILPSSLSPGTYRLQLALAGPEGRVPVADGQAEAWPVASVRILDRTRTFELPVVEHSLQARIGRQARLLGYDLDTSQAHPGGRVSVTLYWYAEGPMVLPFKVFTHLLNEDGTVAAQDDGPPGNGCCPANTWAAGEVIADEHVIPLGADLSPGTLELVTGLYDEPTGVRVPAYDSYGNRLRHDRVHLAEVEISGTVPSARFGSFAIYLPSVFREVAP